MQRVYTCVSQSSGLNSLHPGGDSRNSGQSVRWRNQHGIEERLLCAFFNSGIKIHFVLRASRPITYNERIVKEETYIWTHHARDKLRYYRLTESRVKRIIRYPARVEEGIIEGAIACMQPAHGQAVSGARPAAAGRLAKKSQYSEIWTMYVVTPAAGKNKKIKIITAWRYPGESPKRDPIPPEILREIRKLL